MSLFGPDASELTMKPYPIDCQIRVIRAGHIDYSGKNDEASMVFLVPVEGSARDRFLNAWAPVHNEQYHEVLVDGPFGMFRAAVHKPDMRCEQYYLFVMSGGAEQLLKNRWNTIISQGNNPTSLVTTFVVQPETVDADEAQPMEASNFSGMG